MKFLQVILIILSLILVVESSSLSDTSSSNKRGPSCSVSTPLDDTFGGKTTRGASVSTPSNDTSANNTTRGFSITVSLNDTANYWVAFGFYKIICSWYGLKDPFCADLHVVGIAFQKSRTLFWETDRDDYKVLSSVLLNNEGKLVIFGDNYKEQQPLIPGIQEPASYAMMHDNGNFVLYGSESQVWQSLDYPTKSDLSILVICLLIVKVFVIGCALCFLALLFSYHRQKMKFVRVILITLPLIFVVPSLMVESSSLNDTGVSNMGSSVNTPSIANVAGNMTRGPSVSNTSAGNITRAPSVSNTSNGTPGSNKRRGPSFATFPGYGDIVYGIPEWVNKKDKRLLQGSTTRAVSDLVVAKDGTGNFTSISAAVDAAPVSSTTRFIIYIKQGIYLENIQIGPSKTMIMFLGDGIGRTIVKSNRSVKGGWDLSGSATVGVDGDGFIARDMTFENSAGPSKEQAVAFRSASDLSAFYQCSFVGYQDTLYVHKKRQFYKRCDIYGTIDFIFGNAAVVLQECNLYARKPLVGQQNAITAQGRDDPEDPTGIAIINCNITAAEDLKPFKSSVETYLGRPWKEYSRTVYLLSSMDDVIHPKGWLKWNGDFALKTLYYGEFNNSGSGANTSNRVQWPGYRKINSSFEASNFTVASFIQGNDWLPSTNIPFYPGLRDPDSDD